MAGRKIKDDEAEKRGKRLGEKIRQARDLKKMTREELAKASNVGIDTIRKLERGKIASPSVFMLLDLKNALKTKRLEEWLS